MSVPNPSVQAEARADRCPPGFIPQTASQSAQSPEAIPPLRILLVDDDPDFRSSIRQLLEQQGHQVKAMGDGAKALTFFSARKDEVDLVMLDYLMPGMDGAQMLSHLRQIDPTVPVIVISGAEALRLRRAFLAHRVEHLRKPVRLAEILWVLRRLTAKPLLPA